MTRRSTQAKRQLGLAAIAAGCCLLLFLAYALPDLLLANWIRERFHAERFPFLWAYKHAEASVRDSLQVYGKKAALAPNVVFLAIDSPTIEQSELDPQERMQPALQMMATGWPFPRATYPLILERLADAGAKVVIFDLLFPSPKEGDDQFRGALEKYRNAVVIGSNLQDLEAINGGGRNIVVAPSASLISTGDAVTDSRVGFVNFKPDLDLVVRTAQYRTTPTEYFGELPIGADDPSHELLSLAAQGVSQAGLASLIPTGRQPVLFRFLKDPRERSLHDIFVPALWEKNFANGQFFRGKIVLIGPYGNWSKDELPTPFGPMLGPKIQLSVLNALLTRDYLHQSSQWTDVFLLFLGGAAAAAAGFSIAHPLARTVALLALAAGYVAVAFLLYNYEGLILNLLGPLAALLGSGFIGLVWERVLEQQEKLRVRQTLERYVSKDVVSEVLDNPESFLNTEGGMRKPITVLFSDIRGFTTLTESADPATLVLQLNEYFTEMVRIVFANRGTIDKFIGDAVMAHWGSIVSRGEGPDACRAVAAALHMQQSLPKLNAGWKERGLPEFKIGIGVNHGDAICAHLGSDEKNEVTAIGDAVNLASRLESATKEFHQDILIGQNVAPLVRDSFHLRSVSLLQVLGRSKPVEVYTVLGDRHDTAEPAWLAVHEEAIRLFRTRAFPEARVKFAEVVAAKPGDWLAGVHERRCRDFQVTPPPDEWDGSYVMTRK